MRNFREFFNDSFNVFIAVVVVLAFGVFAFQVLLEIPTPPPLPNDECGNPSLVVYLTGGRP